MDNQDQAIITWPQWDGSNFQIYKSEYRNGKWTHSTDINDRVNIPGQAAGSPRVAMDDSGNAVLVWNEEDGTLQHIFKSEFRNGKWIGPASLTDHISPAGQAAQEPNVAMDNHGNAQIAWYQSDGVNRQIFKSTYRGDQWVTPSSLAEHISVAGSDVWSDMPSLAMSDDGSALIVWSQNDGTSLQIFKSEYR